MEKKVKKKSMHGSLFSSFISFLFNFSMGNSLLKLYNYLGLNWVLYLLEDLKC
jgi:hypothetical protein